MALQGRKTFLKAANDLAIKTLTPAQAHLCVFASIGKCTEGSWEDRGFSRQSYCSAQLQASKNLANKRLAAAHMTKSFPRLEVLAEKILQMKVIPWDMHWNAALHSWIENSCCQNACHRIDTRFTMMCRSTQLMSWCKQDHKKTCDAERWDNRCYHNCVLGLNNCMNVNIGDKELCCWRQTSLFRCTGITKIAKIASES
jgi:hypothetical protein